jgi:hypothetical protein
VNALIVISERWLGLVRVRGAEAHEERSDECGGAEGRRQDLQGLGDPNPSLFCLSGSSGSCHNLPYIGNQHAYLKGKTEPAEKPQSARERNNGELTPEKRNLKQTPQSAERLTKSAETRGMDLPGP